MKIPELDKCCFCASVRTGTLIIATIGAVFSLLLIIVVCTSDVDPRLFLHGSIRDRTAAKVAILIGFALQLIISSLLLLGAYSKNTVLMLPWVVLTPVALVVNAVGTIATTIMLFVAAHAGSAFASFFSGLITCGFGLYYLLVVYTYYRELQNEKRNGQLRATNWEP